MPLPDPKDPKPKSPASSDSEVPQQEVVKFTKEQALNTSVMPTILGVGYGTYQQRPENFLLSFVTHTAALGLMLWLLHLTGPVKIIPPTTTNSVALAPYVPHKVGEGGRSAAKSGEAAIYSAHGTATAKKQADDRADRGCRSENSSEHPNRRSSFQ